MDTELKIKEWYKYYNSIPYFKLAVMTLFLHTIEIKTYGAVQQKLLYPEV